MQKKILVIDDEEAVCQVLRQYLEKRDYEMFAADEPESALTLLDKTPFDLVIVDLLLPEMNGLELLPHIKRRHKELPVILLTGCQLDARIAEEAIEMGASRVCEKQNGLSELMAEIEVLLSEAAAK